MKYIFVKSCTFKIYFAYIFFIKVRYIRQNIFDIYSNVLEIYFRDKKFCICRIYCIFMAVRDTSIFGSLFEGGEVFRKIKLNISKGWKKKNIGFKKN